MTSYPIASREDPQDEIAALVSELYATEGRLQQMAGGELDSVLRPDGQSFLLHEAQNKLRESEAVQRQFAATQTSILNALPAHIALLDHEGLIISVNEGWRSAGADSLTSSSSGVGQNYLELCEHANGACATAARAAAAGMRAVICGETREFSLDYPCPAPAEPRWLRLKVAPLELDGGSGVVVMHLDITESKLTENAVLRTQKRLRSLIDGLGPSMFVTLLTPQGIIVEINQPPLTVAGLKPEDVMGKHFADTPWWHSPDSRQQLRKAITRAARGKSSRYDVRIQGAEGRLLDIDFSLQSLRDESGEVAFLISSASVITARKEAEERLAASEVLLRLFIDHTPAAIAMLDTEMRYIQASERWMQDYQLAGRTIIGLSHYDVFPDAPPRWKEIHQRVLAGAVERCEEDAFTRVDGSVDWLRWEARPWRKAGGEIGGLIFFTQVITAWKEAEAELRFNERRYRSLVETTTAIVWDTPASGEFEAEQPSWSAFTGQNFEEYRGWGWLQAVHPEDHAETTRVWLAAVANRTVYAVEHRLRARDGNYHHMVVRGIPILDDDGTIRQWTGIHTDITERKRAEERIAEQASLIDQSRDAIFLRDLDHHVTFWNKGAERLYGWTAEEAIGRLVGDLLQPAPLTLHEALETMKDQETWAGEIEKTTKAGARLVVASRWTLVRDDHGQPKSILVIDTDITERKKIEQQFLRSQRMESIGTLAGGIAHDLNNSLSPIIMSLDLLAAKFPDHESAELLDIVRSSARRGADMVRQVLSFARGVEGDRRELQIRHLVRDIEKIVNDTFLKSIQVRTVVPHDLWTVWGDATQIHQVLLNLCVNARDAMPDGGKLTISAQNFTVDPLYAGANGEAPAGEYVLLQVEDSGTGMTPEVIAKIFDPFFTTKEVGKGTGLGLSTSLAIVKSHAGFVSVYSEPGNGTRVNVYLPGQTETAAAGLAERTNDLPRGKGELIMIVDDEPSVRMVAEQTLLAFGYRVILAADGAEAVAAFAARGAEIDAVLTDMMMPIMDGPTTIRVLRKLSATLPIIAASGLSASDYGTKFASLGVKHFLPKPYTAATLLKALREALTVGAVAQDC